MLSIGFFARHKKTINLASERGRVASARANNKHGRILPRMFRRPVRWCNRLLDGNFSLSKQGWLALGVGVLFSASAAIYIHKQKNYSFVSSSTASMGFSLKQVRVEGIQEVSEIEVLNRLNLAPAKSLFALDIDHVRDELRQLPWVSDAVVSKSFPDHLNVKIIERKPFAIWQRENSLSLIEQNGRAIDHYDARYSQLPLLVGRGADVNGAEFLFLMKQFERLNAQVSAYVRIGDRRWDLKLKNGIIVRLPSENLEPTLRELDLLDKERQLLARDIEVVDLRLRDRLVVGLSEKAMDRRDRLNKSNKKPNNKKEKKI